MSKKNLFNWNKIVAVAIISSFLITYVGCANGPIRKLLRGGACNTCQPPSPHPSLNSAAGCTNCGPGGQLPIQQPGFDGFSSNNQGIGQQLNSGYGGADLNNGSYYQSNIGGATINPTVGGNYVNGSLGGPIVPPAGSGF